MPARSVAVSLAVVLLGAAMLVWPALMNGYPLLFGDTGVYLQDGIHLHVTWARPMFYGLFMLPLHLRVTTWPVVIVQAIVAACVLLLTLRLFLPRLSQWTLIPVTAALAAATSLPWFVSQLMPDVFAGLLVLTLAGLLMAPERLSRLGQAAALLFASVCITMHLSLLPISLALVATLWLVRVWLGLRLRGADLLRGAAAPALAIVLIVLPNAVFLHKFSPSPYGKIFVLARVLADGPGRNALERECPRPGWTLCDVRAELTDNADDMLWSDQEVMVRAGGQDRVAAQAWPVIGAAVRAEPGTVAWDALRNAATQFVSFGSGDALLKPSSHNDQAWTKEFPPGEQARYRASRQYRGLTLLRAWLQDVHIGLASLSIAALAASAWVALRRRRVIGGLYAAILTALLANAFVSGALSGVFDRYQSRFVWLAVFAALLMLLDWWTERRRSAHTSVASTLR